MADLLDIILDKFRAGDEEVAFYELLELPGTLLPALVDRFRSESQSPIRALLIKVAWERKEEGVIHFLSEALMEPEELVWQQALDGMVAFASQEVREILLAARTHEFADEALTSRFHLWVEEAIQQVDFELRSRV
jgi:hypothetical protein